MNLSGFYERMSDDELLLVCRLWNKSEGNSMMTVPLVPFLDLRKVYVILQKEATRLESVFGWKISVDLDDEHDLVVGLKSKLFEYLKSQMFMSGSVGVPLHFSGGEVIWSYHPDYVRMEVKVK